MPLLDTMFITLKLMQDLQHIGNRGNEAMSQRVATVIVQCQCRRGHFVGRPARRSEISDTASVPWASAQLASPCWWSTGVEKKVLLRTVCQSEENRVSHCCAAVKEEKRKKRSRKKCAKKKVQSESFCNCSHLILPSATAALFLLADWSSCYFMCQG